MEDTKVFPKFVFKGEPLSKENLLLVINLLMLKDKEVPLDQTEKEMLDSFPVQIFLKRIKAYKLPFTITDFFFSISIMTMCDTPGVLMILLRLCYQYYLKTGKTLLGIEDWAFMFSESIPTASELDIMWESQKRDSLIDNMVDDVQYWLERHS